MYFWSVSRLETKIAMIPSQNDFRQNAVSILSRRATLRLMGMGAASAALPSVLQGCVTRQAQGQPTPSVLNQPLDLITKEIPQTKERIPAIGLGTFMTFDVKPDRPRDHLREVLRQFQASGGQMIDVSPLYGLSEVNVGEFARTLGMTNNVLIVNKVWATGGFLGDRSHAQKQFDQSLKRLSRDRLDVMQVHSLVNVDVMLPLLRTWKQEGKVRYVGITHHESVYYGANRAVD